MKLLVTGGRNYSNFERVNKVLIWLHDQTPITLLVSGGATGADYWCKLWAETLGIPVATYAITPRCWKKYGKSAGPRRNQMMLDEEKPDRCIAFPGGRGTADMVLRCEKRGVPVTKSPT